MQAGPAHTPPSLPPPARLTPHAQTRFLHLRHRAAVQSRVKWWVVCAVRTQVVGGWVLWADLRGHEHEQHVGVCWRMLPCPRAKPRGPSLKQRTCSLQSCCIQLCEVVSACFSIRSETLTRDSDQPFSHHAIIAAACRAVKLLRAETSKVSLCCLPAASCTSVAPPIAHKL